MPKKVARAKTKKLVNTKQTPMEISSDTIRYDDPTKTHPSLTAFFGYNLLKVAMQYKAMIENALAQYDLLPVHFGVLRVIERNKDINQNSVSQQMGINKATMVKIIDRLENKKLISRCQSPDDRRANFLNITKAGLDMLEDSKTPVEKDEAEFLKALTADEILQFKKMLARIVSGS